MCLGKHTGAQAETQSPQRRSQPPAQFSRTPRPALPTLPWVHRLFVRDACPASLPFPDQRQGAFARTTLKGSKGSSLARRSPFSSPNTVDPTLLLSALGEYAQSMSEKATILKTGLTRQQAPPQVRRAGTPPTALRQLPFKATISPGHGSPPIKARVFGPEQGLERGHQTHGILSPRV